MKMMIEGVNLPTRKTIGSCGYDIYCPKDIRLFPDEWINLDLGILMEKGDIPEGYCALILPRSSTGVKYKLRLANTCGVIDSDYTMDTIKAMITGYDWIYSWRGSHKIPTTIIDKNTRILQMILVPFGIIQSEIPPTEERVGGIGSTGVKG